MTIPWGRLIPQGQGQTNGDNGTSIVNYDLLPRHVLQNVGSATRSRSITSRLRLDGGCSPNNSNSGISIEPSPPPPPLNTIHGINFIGLKNVKPYDRFNEYLIGRSNKNDIVAQRTSSANQKEDEKTHSLRNTIHSIISNTHCRLFCLLRANSSALPDMEVYIEDSSGNGTYINNTTLLKKNERRILHTGDTICLLNQKIVRKKVKDLGLQKELLDCYSFVFINVHQTHGVHQRVLKDVGGAGAGAGGGGEVAVGKINARTPIGGMGAIGIHAAGAGMHTPTSSGRKRGLVDVRSTNSKSIQRHTPPHTALASAKKNLNSNMMPPPEKKLRTSSMDRTSQRIKPKPMRTIEIEYDLRDEIGSGTCGQVRRAIHRKTGAMVAVKVIAIGNAGGRNRTVSGVSKDGVLDPSIQAEASILQSLNHPYIVKLLDFFVHPGKAVYLVMELLHGGDLFDRIVQKGRYSELESRRVMRRMLASVHYLHVDRDIVHRDLKPENILCDSRTDDITVKLTDFGLAKSMTEDGLKTFCGTPQYFAPEVLRRQNTVAGRGRYGKEADMWSLGVILYILISGAPPFDASANMDAVAAQKISFHASVWTRISDTAKDLISKLLTTDPNKRISVVDACSHEWIMTPDGDTHAHPLEDPVVLEAAGKIKSESDRKTTPKKASPPQSVLSAGSAEGAESSSAILQIISGETSDITPPKSNQSSKKIIQPVQQDDGGRTEGGASPNQSAMFPTPIKKGPAPTSGSPTKKRESLFSFVKQLSNDSAKRGSKDDRDDKNVEEASIEDAEPTVVSVEQNDEPPASTSKPKVSDGAIEEKKSAVATPTSAERDDRTKEDDATQPKQKGKQTTLSSFFGKK